MRKYFRNFVRSIVTIHGDPEDIAAGTAIGFFVAFSPTLGFQMLISAAIATCFRASRAAAIIPVWISNPLTAVPVYGFTYLIGTLVWPGPSASEVYDKLVNVFSRLANTSFWAIREQFSVFLELGKDIIIPMTIGGFIIGGIFALVSYPVTLRMVKKYRLRHGES